MQHEIKSYKKSHYECPNTRAPERLDVAWQMILYNTSTPYCIVLYRTVSYHSVWCRGLDDANVSLIDIRSYSTWEFI